MKKISRRIALLSATGVAAAVSMVVATSASSAPVESDPSATDAITHSFDNTDGVEVTGVVEHTDRTIEITYDTPSVDHEATHEGMSVYVTLPESYLDGTGDYSTLYLLHGGGGQSSNWFQSADTNIEDESELIKIMPEGGKVGWYTDWLDQDAVNQNWMTHHIHELIPFIDHNFRTIADGDHRAIAGLSMGGFGAIHYAQTFPDLFASASSFSGALDTNDPVVRATVTQQSAQHGLPMFGAFGVPVFGQDGRWIEVNPLYNADALHGTQVNLYAGSGSNFNDIDFETIGGNLVERFVGQTTDRMAGSLYNAGVEHHWWMYGEADGVDYCDGGHNFGCWQFSYEDALPRIEDVVLS